MSSSVPDAGSSPSFAAQRLLGAALSGLLVLAASGCSATAERPHVTSSRVVEGMTEEQFTAMCDARGGVVEVMEHCGGLASGAGFSYDYTDSTLSEHTCKGANTCAGFNCVVPG